MPLLGQIDAVVSNGRTRFFGVSLYLAGSVSFTIIMATSCFLCVVTSRSLTFG